MNYGRTHARSVLHACTDRFVSANQDVAETGEPYAYAGDDPVNG